MISAMLIVNACDGDMGFKIHHDGKMAGATSLHVPAHKYKMAARPADSLIVRIEVDDYDRGLWEWAQQYVRQGGKCRNGISAGPPQVFSGRELNSGDTMVFYRQDLCDRYVRYFTLDLWRSGSTQIIGAALPAILDHVKAACSIGSKPGPVMETPTPAPARSCRDCDICGEKLSPDRSSEEWETPSRQTSFLKCGHGFHRECLGFYLSENDRSCPNCKALFIEEMILSSQ